ncbi:hypothetical protein ACHAWF_011498 [Thalassiosira exigua]
MPVSSARASRSEEAAASSSGGGRWQKVSCGMYVAATLPYVVEGVIVKGWWQGDAAWFGIGGSLLFLANGLFDLWLSVRFNDGGTCCQNEDIDAEDELTPRWAERWPRNVGNRLRTANYYFVGSVLYVVAMILYTAASVTYYKYGLYWPGLWVAAAAVFVVHSVDCIVGTLVGNAEPGAKKKHFVTFDCKRGGFRRWQDVDWYLWGDVTFLAAAVFDVVSNYRLPYSGTFISAINWLINAFIYTVGAFAHGKPAPAEEVTASEMISVENAAAPDVQSTPAKNEAIDADHEIWLENALQRPSDQK